MRPGLEQSEIWLQGFWQQVHGPCHREWFHLCPHVLRESRCWLASLWQGCQIYRIIEMEIFSRQEQTLDRILCDKASKLVKGLSNNSFWPYPRRAISTAAPQPMDCPTKTNEDLSHLQLIDQVIQHDLRCGINGFFGRRTRLSQVIARIFNTWESQFRAIWSLGQRKWFVPTILFPVENLVRGLGIPNFSNSFGWWMKTY